MRPSRRALRSSASTSRPICCATHAGVFASLRGMHAEAVVEFERATTLREQSSEAYNNLSCALRQQGDHSAALAAIERAIAMNPGQGESWNSRGMLFMDDGNISEAQRCFDMAVQLAPQHEPSRLNHAQIPWMLGMLDETIQRLEEAVLLLPKSRRLLSRLLMAMHHAPRFAPRRIEAVARPYGRSRTRRSAVRAGRFGRPERRTNATILVRCVSGSSRQISAPGGLGPVPTDTAWRRRRVDVLFPTLTRRLTDQMSRECRFHLDSWSLDADVAAMIVRDRSTCSSTCSAHRGAQIGRFRPRQRRASTWMGFFGTTGTAGFDDVWTRWSCPSPRLRSTEPILQPIDVAVDPRDLPPLPTTSTIVMTDTSRSVPSTTR